MLLIELILIWPSVVVRHYFGKYSLITLVRKEDYSFPKKWGKVQALEGQVCKPTYVGTSVFSFPPVVTIFTKSNVLIEHYLNSPSFLAVCVMYY